MVKAQKIWRDRVAIVTGASTGIGRETAWRLAARGARVVIAARHADRLAAVVAAAPAAADQFLVVPADVTRDADVAQLIDRAVARWGRVDALVNNAGFGLRATIADTKPADARALIEVNFFGALRCLQAVLPVMRAQAPDARGVRGQIVNIGSILSVIATPQNGLYCASKFALKALCDALRLELRDQGIDVILIMPGYTDTPFFDNMIRYRGPARTTGMKGQHPAKVAAAIDRACVRRRREVVLTFPAKVGALVKRFAPGLLDFALARIRHNP